ncbi:MAG: hypothetical protein IFK94_10500 [Acidobacteria bacterium]|uniref:Uncharacterized protein n=1 Tax=Candidatus Polarisedimenticola svalbardensis TaxID=2886004 RepID=A0A8J6XXL9_9BACT|nr:hypothetical protein [Candidatus Polarisedimenticola svalbardensis]
MKRSRRARLRIGFFLATAIWGFILGAGFLAVGMSLSNVSIPRDGSTVGLLGAGILFAVVGGLLASKAYRESRNR